MKYLVILALAMMLVGGCSKDEGEKETQTEKVATERPRVVMETDMGRVVLELFPDVAPNHVHNFMDLARKGFYNGLTFHRVIKEFVIQGGDPKGDGTGNAGYTIAAEFSNLKHMPGTLAMARGPDPNSASSQFYICLSQLPDLDGKYSIFGQVVEGMDAVYKIGEVETDDNNKPVETVRTVRVWVEGEQPASVGEGSTDSTGGL